MWPNHKNSQGKNAALAQGGANSQQGNQGGWMAPQGYYMPQLMYCPYPYHPPQFPQGGNAHNINQEAPLQPPPQGAQFIPGIPQCQYQGRPIREAFEPQMRELRDGMTRPNIQSNNFEISPSLVILLKEK
ncbi:hypothetical protein ACS0TY_015999 [Phlomoides rotata]